MLLDRVLMVLRYTLFVLLANAVPYYAEVMRKDMLNKELYKLTGSQSPIDNRLISFFV